MFRKLLSTALGLSLLFVPEVKARDTFDEHKVLWDSLERAGVSILLNDTNLCDNGASGMYSPAHRILVVCQDERLPLTTREVEWTPNDFDTLRHEAHHVLQDCLDGFNNDTIVPLFRDDNLKEFVTTALTQRQISSIIKTYKEAGADADVIRTELEAFAVAHTVSPGTIAQSIDKTCQV